MVGDGRVVLTTGANSGIGLETALEVASRGFVSVGSVRSRAKADVLLEAAERHGVTVHPVLLDVDDAERCAAVIDEVVDEHGSLFGLVNNAGRALDGAVEDVGDDDARAFLETMLLAPMRLARLALPAMRAHGSGRIVNVSSIYGRTTTPLTGWYQAAKHGMEALSDALRMEVAADGIAVVLVEPGAFRTGIWGEVETSRAEHLDSRYAGAYGRAEQLVRLTEPLMGDPATCGRVIARALAAARPRARYLVGADAVLLAAADQVTPTTVKDRLTRFVLGL